jgi:nucleotide-binding universal stress UspA family protein
MACVDTSSCDDQDAKLNRRIYELAESISKYQGGRFSVVHSWSIWNEQMIKGRVGKDLFSEIENNNLAQVKHMLNEFLKSYGTDADAKHVFLVKGEPADMIPALAKKEEVDLVVMGTVARSGITGIVTGNSAEQILSRIQCSVLALKPDSFVSPIKLESA